MADLAVVGHQESRFKTRATVPSEATGSHDRFRTQLLHIVCELNIPRHGEALHIGEFLKYVQLRNHLMAS